MVSVRGVHVAERRRRSIPHPMSFCSSDDVVGLEESRREGGSGKARVFHILKSMVLPPMALFLKT